MGSQLDLDDVASGNPLAEIELRELRQNLENIQEGYRYLTAVNEIQLHVITTLSDTLIISNTTGEQQYKPVYFWLPFGLMVAVMTSVLIEYF